MSKISEDTIRAILPPKGKRFLLIGSNDIHARIFLDRLSDICNVNIYNRFKIITSIYNLKGWAGPTTIVLLDGYMNNRDVWYDHLLDLIKHKRLTSIEFNDRDLEAIKAIENYF